MRRTLAHRLVSALVAALLLLAYGGELGVVHACPMHDGAARATVAQAGNTHAATGHDAHAAPTGQQDGAHRCSCANDCSAPCATMVLPGAAPAWALVAPAPVRRASILPVVAHEPAPPAHALPFANGPPAVGPAA